MIADYKHWGTRKWWVEVFYMYSYTSWMWGGVVHKWSQVTSAEGMDADEWRDIFLTQWNLAEWISLDSKHPQYNGQFQKSQLSFHLLQFLSNPWIVNTLLLCITDSFHGTNCTRIILTISAFSPKNLDGDSFPGHFCSSVYIILSEKWNKNREQLGMKLPSWSVPTVRDILIDSQSLGASAPILRLPPNFLLLVVHFTVLYTEIAQGLWGVF